MLGGLICGYQRDIFDQSATGWRHENAENGHIWPYPIGTFQPSDGSLFLGRWPLLNESCFEQELLITIFVRFDISENKTAFKQGEMPYSIFASSRDPCGHGCTFLPNISWWCQREPLRHGQCWKPKGRENKVFHHMFLAGGYKWLKAMPKILVYQPTNLPTYQVFSEIILKPTWMINKSWFLAPTMSVI